jgi:sec-independent protein translocase protein TatC
MPLREHLAELRRRLIRSGLAIMAASVAGWYLYDWVFAELQRPLLEVAREKGIQANVNFQDITSPFNLRVKLAVYLGIVIASPVWLYQLWAFVVPGLTRREKRYSMAFVAVGVPLFVGGILLGWLVVPNAVKFFTEFVAPEASVLPSADTYITFVTRLLLVFGVAFLMPLILVACNLAGFLSARAMAKAWRMAVFLVFVFAAIASPTPDAASMLALAFPMVGLYMLAVGFAWLVDRRRARRAAAEGLAGLDDDEASPLEGSRPLEEEPYPVGSGEPVDGEPYPVEPSRGRERPDAG